MRFSIFGWLITTSLLGAHYPDGRKWGKQESTWSTTNKDYVTSATIAFNVWSTALNGHLKFTYKEYDTASPADITIVDDTMNPGRGYAQAGMLVRDGIITSAAIFMYRTTFLYATLLHEIGHCLGLEHSSNALSIMYYQISNPTPELHKEDAVEICRLYGVNPVAPDIHVDVKWIRGKQFRIESSQNIKCAFKDGVKDKTLYGNFTWRFKGKLPKEVLVEYNGWEKTLIIQKPVLIK